MTRLRRILAATDFSEGATRALDLAAELAAAFAVPLLVVHVCRLTAVIDGDGSWPHREADSSRLREVAEEELGRCRERARARRASRVDIELAKGDPAAEILRVAADRGCDLIVLGPHGERGHRWDLGSVAERVLQRATSAVLVADRGAASS